MINLTSLPQTLQSKHHYRSSDTALTYKPVSKELDHLDCVLYRISSVTYHKDTDAPQMQALENVLSSLRTPGINIIYLMLGDKNGVEFYYGVARDYMSDRELKLSIKDIAREILAPSIKGNFRGSKLIELDRVQKERLLQKIQHSTASSVIEGVPGVIEEENFQGADRLADTMINIDSVQDSSFGFMVIASCVNYKEVDSIKTQIYEIYRAIACFAKESVQIGSSDGTSQSEGISKSTSTSESHTQGTSTNQSTSSSHSTSHSQTQGRNEGKSTTKGTNDSRSHSTNTSKSTSTSGDYKNTSSSAGESVSTSSGTSSSAAQSSGKSESITKGSSDSSSTSESKGSSESKATSSSTQTGTSHTTGTQKGSSQASTREIVNKYFANWQEYIDEILLPRLDYASGKGLLPVGYFASQTPK